MNIVKIEWLDSFGITNDWEFKEDMKPMPPPLITSVGIVMEETKKYITIVQSDSDTQVLGRMTIPKVAITKIRRMR